MALSAHTISAKKGSQKKTKRIGRGNGSGKGTYATRGLKGQRSRSGGRSGLARLGFKQALQKVPKLRGFVSPNSKAGSVTLFTLNRVCIDGDVVTPKFLKNKGVISDAKPGAKIVATGELKKKITVKGCKLSKTAGEMIEKAGGSIVS